jgi:FkbM family methyltransferase
MNLLNTLQTLVKPASDRLAKTVPECRLKDVLRAHFYNQLNPDCKMQVLMNGEFFITAMGTAFRVAHVPAFEVGNDLIALRGYLSASKFQTGDVVVDAGASGSGIATICFSKMVGETGRVIALEPDKKSLETLEKNLRLNDIRNVITVNKGLWNKVETLSFNSGQGQSSSVAFTGDAGTEKCTKINCVDLDQLLTELNIPKVAFIKMDIEGAEVEALEGMQHTLLTGKPSLAIASYHVREGKQTYLAMEKTLRLLGYDVHTAHPIHLTTYAHMA